MKFLLRIRFHSHKPCVSVPTTHRIAKHPITNSFAGTTHLSQICFDYKLCVQQTVTFTRLVFLRPRFRNPECSMSRATRTMQTSPHYAINSAIENFMILFGKSDSAFFRSCNKRQNDPIVRRYNLRDERCSKSLYFLALYVIEKAYGARKEKRGNKYSAFF